LKKSSKESNFQKRRYNTLTSRIERVVKGVLRRRVMIIRAIIVKTYMVMSQRKKKERRKRKRLLIPMNRDRKIWRD
jgi:hypothetical protein